LTKEIAKIKSLKSKNSHGYDGISVKILKLSIPFIMSPLIYICNRSLSSGIFPTHLKFSEIEPFFKKGDRTNISDCRPISVLVAFSKIFEKFIYSRLYHINQNNILVNEQYGFRNSSTEKASFKLINDILLTLNKKLTVGGIFYDLEKAFDCVHHNILSKLEFYGIVGKANTLIKSYLSDRYQRVLIDTSHSNNSIYSDWVKIKNGILQGSILGPLFFLFYFYIHDFII
jgi:hypothetical protein